MTFENPRYTLRNICSACCHKDTMIVQKVFPPNTAAPVFAKALPTNTFANAAPPINPVTLPLAAPAYVPFHNLILHS